MARNSRTSKSRKSKSRPTKMGRKWTQDDVLAYNIKVVYQDLQTFFGVTHLPPPNIETCAFTAQDFATAKEPGSSYMLRHMDVITRATDPDNIESSTIDLVRELFEVLHYPNVAQKREVMMRQKLRYLASQAQGRPPQLEHRHYSRLIGRQSGQALARVRSGAPTYFGCHCCLP